MLYAEGVLTDGPYPSFTTGFRIPALGISVNGIRVQPNHSGGPLTGPEVVGPVCDSFPPPCTVVGHWWLDMDDPTSTALLGVPITVSLVPTYVAPGGRIVVEGRLAAR